MPTAKVTKRAVDALELPFAFFALGLAIGPGMQFDHRRPQLDGGFQLPPIGFNEQ